MIPAESEHFFTHYRHTLHDPVNDSECGFRVNGLFNAGFTTELNGEVLSQLLNLPAFPEIIIYLIMGNHEEITRNDGHYLFIIFSLERQVVTMHPQLAEDIVGNLFRKPFLSAGLQGIAIDLRIKRIKYFLELLQFRGLSLVGSLFRTQS